MTTTTSPVEPPQAELTQAPFSTATRRAGEYSRRPYDTLGIAWLNGSFQAAVFRRQVAKWAWTSSTPVRTPEEFEVALDQALVELRFGGTEVFLILEHDAFVHQPEQAPAFSEAAARAYLRGRVERFEKEHEPVLWVSQPTVSARKEATFLLHLLPTSFYNRINGVLLERHLDLARILPLAVPLQLILPVLTQGKDRPVLVAADTGEATTVMVAQPDGQLLFARTMLARWEVDPARIGVEINRSVLYAKQQFSAVIDALWLLGTASEAAQTEVQARCGAGKEILVRNSTPLEWMEAVAKLTPRHPINLVAGYLSRKRRHQLIRRTIISVCWISLVCLGLDTWARVQEWTAQSQRFHALEKNHGSMLAERDRLVLRNAEMQRQRDFIRQVSEERLPAVPSRFLGYVASILPAEAHLNESSVKWDDGTKKWSFHLDGQVEGDEDTGRELIDAFQKTLSHSALRAKINPGARSLVPVTSSGLEASAAQRFSLEGTLFEE